MAEYNGNLKSFLDNATKVLNENWLHQERNIVQQYDEMNEAFDFTRNLFSDKEYLRKWNGQNFETKKNRAVFDIMLHYFSRGNVRAALAGREPQVKQAFIDLCNDDEFRTSLETTTKSMDANRVRFNRWGDAISAISGINLDALKFPK